jgi:enoyl-CoA hydratase/carnithine racemase
MEMLLFGTVMDAPTALHFGMVNRVVPITELRVTAMEYAERLCAESAPLSVRVIKQAVLRGMTMPLDQATFMESLLAQRIRETDDAKEGPRAFAERRRPVWKGR